ncbi:pre-rRNA-processing protein TSR2 -like, partial [Asbolus verrucosus]
MEMDNAFKKVVEQIFNNWTALQLAVDHSMAGTDSKKIALEFINYMTQYCLYESAVDTDCIHEALDDIMDQEFDTICEDGSTKEIAKILYRFIQLVKNGNANLLEEEYRHRDASENKMMNYEDLNDKKVGSSSEITMEEDSGWTEVKSKRKKLNNLKYN